MYLSRFYSENSQGVQISPQQASRFAKEIAGDFNPLHDEDSKRFCVPGDLLFSLVLHRYGLSQRMRFNFAGMVGRGIDLRFPATPGEEFAITDDKERRYLEVTRNGEINQDAEAINSFSHQYVAFSGQNFPHVLVPLLAEQGVMLNTERPLVIYENMSIELDRLDFHQPHLQPDGNQLEINGKRGDVRLCFRILADGQEVGHGIKKLVVSGLRPYEEDKMQALVEGYEADKARFQARLQASA